MIGWSLRRLKYLVAVNSRSLPEQTPSDLGIRYLDIGAVGRGALVAEPEVTTFGSAPSRARRLVAGGDTVVSTVRTYLRAVWRVSGDTDGLVVSTGFVVLSPGPLLDSRYLGWVAQSDPVIEEVVARSVGVSYPGINGLEIGDIRIPVPPLREQRSIADYLDVETAHIDRILAIRRAQAHLLEFRLRALAHSLLSRSATQVQLRRVATIVHGASAPVGEWTQGANGIPFVTVADFSLPGNEAEVRVAERWTDHATVTAGRIPTVPPGSVLFPRVGAALLTNARRIAATKCVVDNPILACIPWSVEPRYLFHWFRTVDLSTVSNPGPVPSVSERQVLELPIPLPSREEQRQIVRQLEIGLEKCDAVLLPIRRQVEALVERRQALITAAVTGQLEIPGVAA